MRRFSAALATLSLLAPVAVAKPVKPTTPDPAKSYDRMVQRVADMVNDEHAYGITGAFNLQLLNVMWEDTGRWEGSSVGPNISDVTIEVEGLKQGKTHHTYLMPVMRYENFTDKTAD